MLVYRGMKHETNFFKLGADREHVLRMKYCPNDYYDKCRSVCFTVERTKKELIILIYS